MGSFATTLQVHLCIGYATLKKTSTLLCFSGKLITTTAEFSQKLLANGLVQVQKVGSMALTLKETMTVGLVAYLIIKHIACENLGVKSNIPTL